MGNFLQRIPTTPYDKSLLMQLKQRKLEDILECVKLINEDYADVQCVQYSQFDDIFCSLMDDTEPFFLELQNEHDLEGTVDIYESLAAFSIFCGDKFEKKATFIFQLFDFDKNGSLELSELVLTLQSAVRGLCKMVHIEPPTLKFLEDLSQSIFTLIDHDNNKRITFQEFMFWIEHNFDLQDFLLKYANTQTFDNLKRRFDQIYTIFKHFFNNAAGGADGQLADEDSVLKLIKTEGKSYMKSEDIEFLMNVLKASTIALADGKLQGMDKMISRKAYESVLKAWSAFSAADINNDNCLSATELRTLLWVYEGEEPSDIRVDNDMRDMDKDHSGFIDRHEWIKNFCSEDKNGKFIFRSNLQNLFEKYDNDNSGYLSLAELKELTKEAFTSYVKRAKDEEAKKILYEMIDNLAIEIFEALDVQGDKSIHWNEFKNYMEIAISKQDKLKKFLETS